VKIKHYLYNTFIIQSGDKKIAIDPGALFLYYFSMTTLIPKSEWNDITHIFVTHGDPDHHWHTDRVAAASNAKVICNETMMKQVNGKSLMLGPRSKGLAFTADIKNVYTISVNETIQLDEMTITGLLADHGPLTLKIGPIKKTEYPGPEERVGWGAMGFKIELNGKTIVNLGDTLLHLEDWDSIRNSDVLMIPIGGKEAHNTMDETEALKAVKVLNPKVVIPCHYNLPAFLFKKDYCAADDIMFKQEVEKMGIECRIMKNGDEIVV
jgi:L-ascorbate metabolism protein UlaG (beta-lactamase superfamily)